MRLPRLSLTARIFLSSAGIVIAVMAATLLLTQRSAEKAAARSIGRGLVSTERRVQELLSSERGVLAGRLKAYADIADYRANIEGTDPDYQGYVQTAAEETGALWVQFVNREGVLQSRSDRPGVAQDTLTGSKLVVDALNGQTGEGFGVTADNKLMELVSVPVEGAGRRSLGALVAANLVTDSIARAVGAQTESEVLLFALDTTGALRLAASTEGARATSETLLAEAQRSIDADTGGVELTSVSDSAAAGALEVNLGGEKFVARRAMLNNA